MLSLVSEHWSVLGHAYGSAGDIPPRLQKLGALPDDADDAEPWFYLWSALAHQGDVFQASFAAVPHIVAALSAVPATAPPVFLHFPAWIEICRIKSAMTVDPVLADAYFESLSRLPMLAAVALSRPACDASLLQCALAAIAASKGQAVLAESLLELTPDVAEAFLDWHFRQ